MRFLDDFAGNNGVELVAANAQGGLHLCASFTVDSIGWGSLMGGPVTVREVTGHVYAPTPLTPPRKAPLSPLGARRGTHAPSHIEGGAAPQLPSALLAIPWWVQHQSEKECAPQKCANVLFSRSFCATVALMPEKGCHREAPDSGTVFFGELWGKPL